MRKKTDIIPLSFFEISIYSLLKSSSTGAIESSDNCCVLENILVTLTITEDNYF